MLLLQIWFQVKAANPHLSVCQIGATIGRMWRELSEAEKQRHLEEFQQDKVSLLLLLLLLDCIARTTCVDVVCHQLSTVVRLSVCRLSICHTSEPCKSG